MEVRLGVWEGLTEAEVRARDAAGLAARRRDPEHVAPEGGETLLEVRARALAAVAEITERHPGAAVAVVAHGAINKSILLAAIGTGQQAYWRIGQANGAINVLEWDGAGGRVVLLNGTAHLDGHDAPEAPPDPSSIPPRETS